MADKEVSGRGKVVAEPQTFFLPASAFYDLLIISHLLFIIFCFLRFHLLCSIWNLLLPFIIHLRSSIFYSLASFFYFLSSCIIHLGSSMSYLLSSICYLLSSIFYLLSSLFYLLSSIFYLLYSMAQFNEFSIMFRTFKGSLHAKRIECEFGSWFGRLWIVDL